MEVFISFPRSKHIDESLNKHEIYEMWKDSVHRFIGEKDLNEYLDKAKNDDFFKGLGKGSYFLIMKGTCENLNERIKFTPYKTVDMNWKEWFDEKLDVKDIKNQVSKSNDTAITYNKDGLFDKDTCPNFDDDVINKLNELIDLLKDFKLDEGVREVFNSNWKVYMTDVFRDSFINVLYKGKDCLMFTKDGGVVNLTDNRSINDINIRFVSDVILDKIKDKTDIAKYLNGNFYNSYKDWQVKNNDRSR